MQRRLPGTVLRDAGMEKAVTGRRSILLQAREIACALSSLWPEGITIDDVVTEYGQRHNRSLREALGNGCGSVFKAPGWTMVGYRPVRHASGHSRRVGVWKFTGGRS